MKKPLKTFVTIATALTLVLGNVVAVSAAPYYDLGTGKVYTAETLRPGNPEREELKDLDPEKVGVAIGEKVYSFKNLENKLAEVFAEGGIEEVQNFFTNPENLEEFEAELPSEEELEVVEVSAIDGLTVTLGEEVELPATVTATLNDEEATEVELAIAWDEFEIEEVGELVVYGAIVLDEDAEYTISEELELVSITLNIISAEDAALEAAQLAVVAYEDVDVEAIAEYAQVEGIETLESAAVEAVEAVVDEEAKAELEGKIEEKREAINAKLQEFVDAVANAANQLDFFEALDNFWEVDETLIVEYFELNTEENTADVHTIQTNIVEAAAKSVEDKTVSEEIEAARATGNLLTFKNTLTEYASYFEDPKVDSNDHLAAYMEDLVNNTGSIEKIQTVIDAVNARFDVIAMIEGLPAVEDITYANVYDKEEVVEPVREAYNALVQEQQTKVTNLDKLTAVEVKITAIKGEITAALDAVNGMKTESNEERANTELIKQNADKLGLDLTEFDKLIPNRRVAAINDLIQNNPKLVDNDVEGYTKETLKATFDEIVATRLVFEESVELFASASTEEPLTDLTYITMLIDQLESVSYEKHSDKSIREVRLPELQKLVDRFDALEGKEVVLNGDEKATDAQKAVLETIKYTEENSKSSTRTRNALDTALTVVEDLIVKQATPTGFEVVEKEIIKITAGEEVEFTIHAVKDGEEEDKVAPFEKFNRTYENVKVNLNNDTFFYRDIEFVNGVAKVAVPVKDAEVTSITIEADAFKVEDNETVIVPGHDKLSVTVEVSPAELDEVAYVINEENEKEITFTAKDAFGNTINDFKGNKVVMLPEGVKSKDPASDATGKALVNFEEGVGTIELTEALEAGTYTFTVGGEEVVIVIPEAEDNDGEDDGTGETAKGVVTYIVNEYLTNFSTPRLVLEDIDGNKVTKNIASFDAWFFGDADNTVVVSEEAMVAWLSDKLDAQGEFTPDLYVDVTEDNELVVTVADASDEAENANELIGIYIVSNDTELLAALDKTNLDTIVLATGETFDGFTVDKPVTITGDAVVKGSITVNANDVVLKDFAMKDYTLNSGGMAILVNGDGVELKNLTFNSFDRPDNKTLEIQVNGSGATIKDVVVNRGEEIVSGNPAILVNSVPMAIEGNIVDAAIAFQVGTSTENVVKNNTIRRAWAEGFFFYPSSLNAADTQQLVNDILDENTVENYGEVNAAHPVKGQSSTGNWFFAGDEVTP